MDGGRLLFLDPARFSAFAGALSVGRVEVCWGVPAAILPLADLGRAVADALRVGGDGVRRRRGEAYRARTHGVGGIRPRGGVRRVAGRLPRSGGVADMVPLLCRRGCHGLLGDAS